jgi:hypothetical protein
MWGQWHWILPVGTTRWNDSLATRRGKSLGILTRTVFKSKSQAIPGGRWGHETSVHKLWRSQMVSGGRHGAKEQVFYLLICCRFWVLNSRVLYLLRGYSTIWVTPPAPHFLFTLEKSFLHLGWSPVVEHVLSMCEAQGLLQSTKKCVSVCVYIHTHIHNENKLKLLFILQYWGLNSTLSHSTSPIFVRGFSR